MPHESDFIFRNACAAKSKRGLSLKENKTVTQSHNTEAVYMFLGAMACIGTIPLVYLQSMGYMRPGWLVVWFATYVHHMYTLKTERTEG